MVKTTGEYRLLLKAGMKRHAMFLSNFGCPGACANFSSFIKCFLSKCFMNSSRNEDTIGFKPDVFVYLVFGFGGKTRMNNMITLLFRR